MEAAQLTTNLANRLNGIKILRWEFDPELSASSGRLTFWSKTTSIEIEFSTVSGPIIAMTPRLIIGRLSLPIPEWQLMNLGKQAKDEDEVYDLVMATFRGIANAMK